TAYAHISSSCPRAMPRIEQFCTAGSIHASCDQDVTVRQQGHCVAKTWGAQVSRACPSAGAWVIALCSPTHQLYQREKGGDHHSTHDKHLPITQQRGRMVPTCQAQCSS